jgi:predicted membrane-bound spermidine synthase
LYGGLGLLILPSLLLGPLFLPLLALRRGRIATGLLMVASLACFLTVFLLRDTYYRELLSSGLSAGA